MGLFSLALSEVASPGGAARGSREKSADCEACGAGYTYTITRTATGRDKSWFSWDQAQAAQKAHADALKNLDKLLDAGCDAAPCPHCGWTPEATVAAVRARSYPALRDFARFFFLMGAAGLALTAVFAPLIVASQGATKLVVNNTALALLVSALLGAGGLPFWALRRSLNAGYDPNRGRLLEVERGTR